MEAPIVAFYLVLLLLFAGGAVSLALGKREAAAKAASAAVCAASLIGFCASLYFLLTGASFHHTLPFPVPLGACAFAFDAVSAVFLLPVFLITGLGALIMPARLHALSDESPIPVLYDRHGCFFCLLAAGMVMVLLAADAVFFVVAWEIMSLAPFFLISPKDGSSRERNAAWLYLVAAHLGALALLFLFADMSVQAGASGFADFTEFSEWRGKGFLFVLALLGFGVKIGLIPVHLWMPETYAASPPHVAVVLSGAMLNLGLYGIVRVLMLLGPVDAWWPYVLMGAGAISGIAGILMGLAQDDMKRTLAYSSTENMGIVLLSLGAGLHAGGQGFHLPMTLLIGAAFLHMWNHSIFKSLLFLGAGVVRESAGFTLISLMGGLLKRLPLSGYAVAVGCAAIAGLPPCNGFMGELLMYTGFIAASMPPAASGEASFIFWGGAFALAAISGMSLFTFARLYGLAFLGAPRSPIADTVHEPEALCRSVLLLLAGLCVVLPLAGGAVFNVLSGGLGVFLSKTVPGALQAQGAVEGFALAENVLFWYAAAGVCLLFAVALAFALRRRALARADADAAARGAQESVVQESVTWGCGYPYGSARVQYTGGSFSHTLATQVLSSFTKTRVDAPKVEGFFPASVRVTMETPDWYAKLWEKAVFRPFASFAGVVKSAQSGLVNVYVLYIFIALIAALVWALGWS